MSGQYNDVRGDFQYKLTLDQGTPANADADRHLFVIFAPQPGDSALFMLFFITLGRKRYHTGSQTLSNLFANAHSIAQTDVNSRSCIRAQYSIYLPVHYRRIKSLLFLDGTPFWDFFAA